MDEKNIKIRCKFIRFRNNKLHCKCEECNKPCIKLPNEAIKNFPILYKFCNGKTFSVARKRFLSLSIHGYLGKFDKTSIPPKEAFYSKLNFENITDEDYARIQKVWEVFEIINLSEYHDLYAQSDTLLLADVFENFRNNCNKIYRLYPSNLLAAPGLTWKACLKIRRVELKLLTNIDMLLMIENEITGGICQASYRYDKAKNKYMDNYDENIESSYI